MSSRTVNAFIVAFVLTFGATAFWTADTTGRAGDDAANIVAARGAEVGATEADTAEAPPQKKRGGFMRVFKAPFKAVGRLFGGGHNDARPAANQVARPNAQDARQFASVAVLRVNDSRTPAPPDAPTGGTAREYLERGRALLAAGQFDAAVTALARAAALDPQSPAHRLLAVAYERQGQPEHARKAYERAVAAAPEDPQALNDLGYALYLNGNYRAAVDRLKRAARLAPGDERIWNNLALAQCRLGKFNEAYKSFAHAGGEFTGRLNTGTLAERMGRDTEAIAQYEAARRLQPAAPVVLRRLAALYQRVGTEAKAADAQATRASLPDATVAARD